MGYPSKLRPFLEICGANPDAYTDVGRAKVKTLLQKLAQDNEDPAVGVAVEDVQGAECDEYIRIFEYSNIFDPNIYSDICSYHFLDTNIFGYSFVSTFWIRIYSDIRS